MKKTPHNSSEKHIREVVVPSCHVFNQCWNCDRVISCMTVRWQHGPGWPRTWLVTLLSLISFCQLHSVLISCHLSKCVEIKCKGCSYSRKIVHMDYISAVSKTARGRQLIKRRTPQPHKICRTGSVSIWKAESILVLLLNLSIKNQISHLIPPVIWRCRLLSDQVFISVIVSALRELCIALLLSSGPGHDMLFLHQG